MEKEVLEQLKKGGVQKSGEIADASGIDKKIVDKTIKKLVAEGIVFSPKRCYYEAK